jgi:mycothiol system anti-sigma-R factor
MSCGKHHETPCHEVLERVWLFLDRELDGSLTYQQVEQHLVECGPCLHEFDVDRAVKSLVRRSSAEHAPDELRLRVLTRIHELRIELTEAGPSRST